MEAQKEGLAWVWEQLDTAIERVRRTVEFSECPSKTLVSRYTAAVAVNFTDWLGKTLPWVRHEMARHAVVDNLRCESVDDHVGMLLDFAARGSALPCVEHYNHVDRAVAEIRGLFRDPTTAGLSGVALCAVLETTSAVFIPDLARRGKELGVNDFTYTDIHGEADAKHSDAFVRATAAEMTMGYRSTKYHVEEAFDLGVDLIKRIYENL